MKKILFLFIAFLTMQNLLAQTKTWTGTASKNWNTASNWSPSGVPGSADEVSIPDTPNDPEISSGSFTVKQITISASALLTINGGATLSVSGTTRPSISTLGAQITVSGSFINNGTLNVSTTNPGVVGVLLSGSGAAFTNGGTATFSPSESQIKFSGSNQTATNTATGVINFNGIYDGIYCDGTVTNVSFVNQGSITYTGGLELLAFVEGCTLTNSGTLTYNGATPSARGIYLSGATLINNACGKISLINRDYFMQAAASTTNSGSIIAHKMNNAAPSTFTNAGVLKYNTLQNGTITQNTGSVIVNNNPTNSTIFTYQGTFSGTIGIFTNESATISAGNYNQNTNTFTPSGVLPTGSQTLYARITPTAGGCFYVVPFTYNNGCTQVATATETMSWNGSVSSDWTNPCNWTPNGVPTQTNPVVISSAVPVVIPTGTNAAAKSISLSGGFGNKASLTISQGSTLRMGSTESTVTKFTMVQYATVTNNGQLILETSGGGGVNSTFEMGLDDNVFHNYGGVVINSTNATPIQIGNNSSNPTNAIFHNYACASFTNSSGAMLLNSVGTSSFNNAGLFRTSGNLGAVGTFTNQNGGVVFVGGTLTHNPITTNNGSVRVNVTPTATTMFTYNGTYNGTIEIFTDAGVSNSAGTYNQATNTFTPSNGLPAGSVTLYIKITSTANNCSYVVPIIYQNGCPQVATSTDNMTWNGSVSSDWTNSCNWTPNGVPGAGNVIFIPTSSTYPTIAAGVNASVKQVNMTGNSRLTVATGASLTVQNNNNGVYLSDNAQFINRGSTTVTNTSTDTQTQYTVYTASTTTIDNYGTLTANGGQNYGGYFAGTFNNKTGATLTASGYRGVYIGEVGKIINESNATINATGSNIGLVVGGQNTTSSNSGTINSSKIEIVNATTFTNQNCGVIKTTGNLDMSGNSIFNNYGYANMGGDLGHYVATTNNYGVLKYNNLVGSVNNTANSVVVNNSTPIFTFGASYNGNVNGIFTNEAATTSAGTYNQANNTFTPSGGLPTGSQTLYAKITPNTGGCFYVVPFTYTNAGQPDYSISTSGNNLVITDLTGTGETLDISQNGSNIRFNVTGKKFSLNNGTTTNFPADVPLSGLQSITVNTANGNDIIDVGAFSNEVLPSLTINGGTGDDQVNFKGDITFITNANLDVDLQNDDANPGVDAVTFAINANIGLQGTGVATLKVSKNVTFNNGSTLGTNNGNLTIEANQQASPTVGNFKGISMNSSTQMQVLGSGLLTVKGKGGNDALGGQAGIFLDFGGVIYGGTNTVTVVGNGGASSGNSNHGIFIQGSTAKITSLGGAVTVQGTGGGTGSSSGNEGVRVTLSGQITSAAPGAVTVTGRGGNLSTGGSNIGVDLQNTSKITSVGGSVTVNAYGGGSGTSQVNYGLSMSQSAEISAGGTGSVTITGEGGTATGSSNHGIALEGLITSEGGNISLTGKAGGGSSGTYGIYMSKQSGAPVSSITTEVNGGNITITTNSLRIVDSPDIRTKATGTVTLKPFTAGAAIDISFAPDGANAPLILSDTELDRISTGTLIIGDGIAGDITVGIGVTRPTSTNMQLISNGDVVISGGNINTSGGTLFLDPGASTKAVKPTFNGTDVTASTLSFANGDLQIALNGTTLGDGTGSTYSQLNVAGAVNLTGLNLTFTGSYTPVGGETFTIVSNDGTDAIVGTFNGLAQGATIPNFRGSGLTATISYTGGSDNNDVVITVASSQPDYSITTSGNNLVITDLTGTGETLDISQNGSNIRFNVTGKKFSLNNGTTTNFPADVALNNLASITVNTANGSDIINVGAFTGTLPSLIINGGTGDDQVNFNGDITFTTNANLDVDLQNDDANPGVDAVMFEANANVSLSGTGGATLKVSKNVSFNTGSSLVTTNGALTIEANQQDVPTTAGFYGINVGASVNVGSTGSGAVTLRGKGGATGGSNRGISVAGTISGGIGTLTLIGQGGAGTGIENIGIRNVGTITSLGGNVSVTATGGGAGASHSNFGIYNEGTITAGNTGTVTVSGTGGQNGNNANYGVYLTTSNALITSSGGNVSVTGQGGGGTPNDNGIQFLNGNIGAGGAGSVTIRGTANGQNGYGVFFQNGTITSSGGNISLTGEGKAYEGVILSNSASITAGGTGNIVIYGAALSGTGTTNRGITVNNTSQISTSGGNIEITAVRGNPDATDLALYATLSTATNGGNITLIADDITMGSTAAVTTQTGGQVSIRPRTNSTPITLGSGPATSLSLDDDELDAVSTGTLNIGNANSGSITINRTVSRPAATAMNLTSNGAVTTEARIDLNGGNLHINANTGTNPDFSGTDLTVGTVSFTTNNDLNIAINGTTMNTGYKQLNVAGGVNLTGVDLVFSGSYTPVGGETFTIVSNDGTDAIVGTFNGLAQGATIPNFRGSSLTATISYTGGSDNNDVVITVALPAAAEINVKGNNQNIVSGDNTPIITDHTDFGPVSVPSGSVTRTFTIENPNTATIALILGTITGGNTDFVITQPSLTTIPVGGSTTFTVTFDPTVAGKRTATISIPSNDSDENPYTFAIEGYGGKPFITTWKTDQEVVGNTSITIPTKGTGYNYDVDWNNDGIFDQFGVTGNVTHNYGTPGTYTVAIRGLFPHIYFENDADNNLRIIAVNQWGDIDWKSFEKAFLGCENLQINASDTPDLNDVADMSDMFTAIAAINQDISGWDVSNVTNMASMFSGVYSFNQNISGWNVSKVTNMSGMFGATAFNQNIGSWDVSKVTSMQFMFFGTTAFNQSLAAWGTKLKSDVNLANMLDNCGMSVANYDATLIGFNLGTATGRSLGAVGLKYCESQSARTNLITNKGWTITGDALASTCLPDINVKGNSQTIVNGDNTPVSTDHTDFGPVTVASGSVTRTFTIENPNTATGNLILGTITGGTTDFTLTQPSLTTIPAGSSTTFTVTFDPTAAGKRTTTISIPSNDPDENPYTFALEGYGGKPFITTWKTDNTGTSNSTSITIPTTGTGYNYDVDWNNDGIFDEFGISGNVTHDYSTAGTYTVAIRGDFSRIHFNSVGDASKLVTISQWGDIAWTSMASAFNGCNNLTVNATDVPNLSGVSSLSSMFTNCTTLNGPANIGSWNTSTITSMSRMFQEATSFNQNISNWDVSNVTNMSLTFQNAAAFDQSLAAWGTKLKSDVNLTNMLDNCGMSVANYDATLIGFNQSTATGRSLGAAGLKYCTAVADRNNLLTTKSWTITGDAQDIACSSPDYTITTTSNAIVVTDAKGASETVEISENSGKIRFNVTGKTYSIDGGLTTAFTTPAEVALASKTSIVINTEVGNDIINVGAFTTQLPSLTINGGTGDDAVNFNGNITFASNANLDLDLQNDDANAGTDAVLVANNVALTLSGTGTATVKVSKNVTLNTGSSLLTQNGNLVVEANQQAAPSTGDFAGINVAGGTLKVTGSGQATLKGKGGTTFSKSGVSVSNGGVIEGGTAAVSVIGTGGIGSGNENIGVSVTGTNSKITSSGGNVSVTGQGAGVPNAYNQHGVLVKTGGMITAGAAGTVTVQGTGATQTNSDTYGIHLDGGTITSSGGNVSVTGLGGGNSTSYTRNHGIYLQNAALLSAGGTGTVTANGTGGNGTNGYHQGIFVVGSAITSNNGNISLTGQSGAASESSNNRGVVLDNTSRVAAGGTGNVTVEGTGTSSIQGFNYGVQLDDSNCEITTNNGNIRIIGQGGQGITNPFSNPTGNTGVGLSGRVIAGGTGTIYIEGTGASQSFSDGVEVGGVVSTNDGTITIVGVGGANASAQYGSSGVDIDGTITAGNGKAITIQGTAGSSTGSSNIGVYIRRNISSTTGGSINVTGIEGGSGVGIEIESLFGGQITTATAGGDITFIANSINLKNTADINTNASSTVTLRPYTNGVSIDLGGTTDALGGPLSLSDAELDRITAGKLQIGNVNSGAITVSTAISRAAATNVNLTTAGAVNLNTSALNLNGGNLIINALSGVNPTAAGTDVNVGTVSFTSGNDLAIVINGTTPDTDYRQLNVEGSVNLSGLDLVLSGSHVPTLGQSFVIVNNDGSDAIQGTFNGLPEGATIASFLGSQLNARISYSGGDGNDVALTAIASVELPTNTANATICKNATASLNATCRVGQETWYNSAGTTQLFVGSSFVTPTLSASTGYKVRCELAPQLSGFVDVMVTVVGPPTISLTTLQQTLNEGNNPVLCDTDTNPVNSLQFSTTTGCVVGTPVWRVQVGSGAWSAWSTAAPVTQSSNNQPHRYQAACDANCASTYSGIIELTINYRSSTPQNVSLLVDGVTVKEGETKEICGGLTTNLTFNSSCASGELVLYSVDGGEYSSVLPTSLVDNQFHNYRVRCRKSDGTPSCVESESGVMRLKIVSPPSAPTVSLSSAGSCTSATVFSGQSSCGSLQTIWYNATTNAALPNLPTNFPVETTSFYARCQTSNGCLSEKSNVVTFTVTATYVAPVITASQEIVCTGTTVRVSANCPAGSQTFWNTGVTTPSFEVAFNNVTKQTYWAKCIFEGGCQSSESVRKDVYWNAFVVTMINVGQSKSAVKPSNDKALWSSQFITKDGGPELEQSTQVNPTLYYVENPNKVGPRYWTINVDACGLGTDGSLTFDLLATPETGVPQSFNTHENNAPYFMYANREGWTELYAQNHPAYGFYQDNGVGGNTYDAGLPKGLYKLGIRYWDQKGWGSIYPSTRQPQGNVLAYQEYWFRIQSKDGIGIGAARAGVDVDTSHRRTDGITKGAFATVFPNPVSNILRLQVENSKGQAVQTTLTDASGRRVLSRGFVPETNSHQEEFGVSELPNGVYFLTVKSELSKSTLLVVKL